MSHERIYVLTGEVVKFLNNFLLLNNPKSGDDDTLRKIFWTFVQWVCQGGTSQKLILIHPQLTKCNFSPSQLAALLISHKTTRLTSFHCISHIHFIPYLSDCPDCQAHLNKTAAGLKWHLIFSANTHTHNEHQTTNKKLKSAWIFMKSYLFELARSHGFININIWQFNASQRVFSLWF